MGALLCDPTCIFVVHGYFEMSMNRAVKHFGHFDKANDLFLVVYFTFYMPTYPGCGWGVAFRMII